MKAGFQSGRCRSGRGIRGSRCWRIKKTVFDEDLIAIVDEQTRAENSPAILGLPRHQYRQDRRPAATVRLRTSDNIYLEGSGSGDGGLDAAFSVIKKLTHTEDTVLQDYRVGAVTMGTDARVQPMWF